MSLTCFNYRFTPSWLMTIITSLFISFFIYLGWWQMTRAAEKQSMLANAARMQQMLPKLWQAGTALPPQYQRIQLTGKYLPLTIFLDNQHYQHQFGYHILTPLELSNNQVVLIDRGWVKGDNSRQQLPAISQLNGLQAVQGEVYYPAKNYFVLGQVIEKKSNNQWLTEFIDPIVISQFLHKTVYPFIIHLDKAQKFGFVREWPVVAFTPARHHAYALQWFVIALVILIIFIALNTKKIK